MNNLKVSVIIPVYNVENYLRECLDSIINQSLKDIEIICINDGSTDNSLNILYEYEKKDTRIRVINQTNRGLGATRNVGLSNANGEYIYFMDSDDYLELTTLDELYSLAKEKSLDIVLFKLINFHDENGETFQTGYYDMNFLKERVHDNVFSYKDVKDKVFEIAVSAPGKLFKKSLISEMRFPEDIIFEDNPFFVEAIFTANRLYFYDKYLYYRRIRNNSITSSQFANYSDAISILNMIIDIVKRLGLFDEFAVALYNRKINQLVFRFGLLDDEYKPDFFIKMKNDFLSHKQEYESDDAFKLINSRLENAFYSCIGSDSYKEFDLHLEMFNYKNEISSLNQTNNNLSNNIIDFENQINLLNEEISFLRQSNDNLTRTVSEIKSQHINPSNDFEKENLILKNENNKLIFDNLKLKDSNNYFQDKCYNLLCEKKNYKSTKTYKLWFKYNKIRNKL